MANFCVIEGVDGTGKSHLAEVVRQHGQVASLSDIVVVLKDDVTEQQATWATHRLNAMHRLTWSYAIDEPVWNYSRQYWLFSLLAWFELFYAEYVAPQLALGRTVITDGWYFKHQARFRLSGDQVFVDFANSALQLLPRPDLVVLLDTPLVEIAARKQHSKPSERGVFESVDGCDFFGYQQRVREALYEVLRMQPCTVRTLTPPVTPSILLSVIDLGCEQTP